MRIKKTINQRPLSWCNIKFPELALNWRNVWQSVRNYDCLTASDEFIGERLTAVQVFTSTSFLTNYSHPMLPFSFEHSSSWPVRLVIFKKLLDEPKECLTLTDFSRQELDPPEAVDLETTAKIKVPSQITQPDLNNDQTMVGIATIKRYRLTLSQADSGIQNSSSYDWQLSSWASWKVKPESSKFVVCNPCESSPSLTILVPLRFIINSIVYFSLS